MSLKKLLDPGDLEKKAVDIIRVGMSGSGIRPKIVSKLDGDEIVVELMDNRGGFRGPIFYDYIQKICDELLKHFPKGVIPDPVDRDFFNFVIKCPQVSSYHQKVEISSKLRTEIRRFKSLSNKYGYTSTFSSPKKNVIEFRFEDDSVELTELSGSFCRIKTAFHLMGAELNEEDDGEVSIYTWTFEFDASGVLG